MATPKVPVKAGQTLQQFAKANKTTVSAILADPRNATIASRVSAGATPVFAGTTIAIPAKASTSAPAGGTVNTNTLSGIAAASAGANSGSPTVSNASSDALRKLTSGQALTDAEKGLLGIGGGTTSTTSVTTATKTPTSTRDNGNGTITIFYSDGTSEIRQTSVVKARQVTSTVDNGDGTFTVIYDDGTYEITGTKREQASTNNDALLQFLLAQQQTAAAEAAKLKETTRQSAIATVTARFKEYGLESLASKIKELAVDGATESTITLALQETDEYKTRFKANQARLKAGLQVLQPAEYLNLEDGYRQVLRAYGMNQFATDEYVQKFIENDLSAKELSDRVTIAVQQVQNADPAILKQLKDYYGIGASDAAAYILDPNQQITKIQRQVAAAQIGVAAGKQGLQSNAAVSEQLAAQGITQAEAQKGYATIADILPTAEKLSQIYGDIGTYDQSTAEQEIFNQLASAQRKRQQLTAREIASFSGSSGLARGGLSTGKTAGQV